MPHTEITSDSRLQEYCRQLVQSESIAFDTEFVSENTYRPVLCLVQVALGERLALIDATSIKDMAPFWEAVARPGHETIVHAGRGEVEFCLRATGRTPAGLLDVQIAAGLIGLEYPAGYSTLISKLLGLTPDKHETRTDWRRRPLSPQQVEYALDDVRHLPTLRDKLVARLGALGRMDWLREEMNTWQDEVQHSNSRQRWRRVSGGSGLGRRSLAILRELWHWREAEAERRDSPVRRVLRDDLLVELARRQTADMKRIEAVRGLSRGDLRRRLPEISECIRRAMDLPEQECPALVRREKPRQLTLLGQFLFSALGSVCNQAQLAPGLVGTPSDVRELVAYRNAKHDPRRDPPALARGWRAEVVGKLFEELLSGRVSIRIGDPAAQHPLVFEPVKSDT